MAYYRTQIGSGGIEFDWSSTFLVHDPNGEYVGRGNCALEFWDNSEFNFPVNIGNQVNNCYGMFLNCSNFNQPINIPDTANDCGKMFSGCTKFNQPVTIGTNANNCSYMFTGCQRFNQPIVIPTNVDNCTLMFSGCNDMCQNIYIKKNNNLITQSMISGHNNQKQINIFCENLALLNKTWSQTIVGYEITWTSMTNGYYNTAFNVYLYNNLPVDI